MFLRTALLFLALTISQVAATSVLHQRSIEFLESRQTSCSSICSAFSDAIAGCSSTACICNGPVAASLQACVTCAVTTTPTPAVISSAQQLIDTYAQTCSSVPGVPAVTLPPVSDSTTTTRTTSRTTLSSIARPTSTTPIVRSTITGASTPPVVVQSTFSSIESSTDDPSPTATNGLPGVFTNDGTQSYNAKQAGLVAISAMLGAALVF